MRWLRWGRVVVARERWLIVAAFVCLTVVALLLVWASSSDAAFAKHCKALGGHTTDATAIGTGVSSNGQVVTTSSVTTYCLSPSGGILDTQ